MKVLVGSKNPVKLDAVKDAFSNYFDSLTVLGFDVDSKVPDQPVNEDTLIGARNRALQLKQINNDEKLGADYFVGVEGGIGKNFNRWFAYGGMCIINEKGLEGYGTSAHFELPDCIVERLLNGEELGYIMDELLDTSDTKRKTGAIHFFTKGVMNRKDLYVPGLITALIPLMHENLFFKNC
ncbi:MAG: inosine/xanthosine triphosphatase [Melioribacteraceae bacterium]|nr:inosine/xanthosine triphosphatase [Melioribacteraceae bacterium]MCF8353580.1 inosine/xanthosine triphosphatase [Melioribacteraceae bacterium]MCF8393503.1 inosine/xanthosine triphosphatase [Melioribacteraceae bacterium]MCF8419313.1 inosine/xanthosine triphosphatase [Melioribacteraceae bacterium]